jgi:uncharacterized RDD family membrane protein YckC
MGPTAELQASADTAVSRQGQYAGPVSRLIAFGLDILVAWGLVTLAVAAISFTTNLFTSRQLSLSHPLVFGLVYGIWIPLYFSYQWALSGQTVGMATVGVRVVGSHGGPIGPRQAVLRTLTFPLAVVTLGVGFAMILYQRERRAIYDQIADTAVVYSWDARGARLRLLARRRDQPGQ